MNLQQFSNGFDDILKKEQKINNVLKKGRALLTDLLLGPEWFQGFLKQIILDKDFRQQQKPSRWMNEYTIYRSPERSFVVLAYIWEPHQIDVIHDHNSWGIIGTLTGEVGERKYRRIDDGTRDGYAELKEASHRILLPGDTTFVMQLDGGIHRMENLTDCSISINVYGKSFRKGYLHYYDYEHKTVTRTYIYPLYRAALAIRALGHMDGPMAKDVLKEAMGQPIEDVLKREAELSLIRFEAKQES